MIGILVNFQSWNICSETVDNLSFIADESGIQILDLSPRIKIHPHILQLGLGI